MEGGKKETGFGRQLLVCFWSLYILNGQSIYEDVVSRVSKAMSTVKKIKGIKEADLQLSRLTTGSGLDLASRGQDSSWKRGIPGLLRASLPPCVFFKKREY